MTHYLTMDEVVLMHEILIRKFGGSPGLRDRGALDGAIHRPQSGYYPDIQTEAAALFESLVINHPLWTAIRELPLLRWMFFCV